MAHCEKITSRWEPIFSKVKWNDLIELFKAREKCRVKLFHLLSCSSMCCKWVIQFARISLDFKSNHILPKSCLMLWTWIDFKISDYVKKAGAACMQHLSLFSPTHTFTVGRMMKKIFDVPERSLWEASTNSKENFWTSFRIISYRLMLFESWHIRREWKMKESICDERLRPLLLMLFRYLNWHFLAFRQLEKKLELEGKNVNYLKSYTLTCSQMIFESIFTIKK